MNTGLLGTLLHQFPYKFHGSSTISTCFWVLNVTLFTLFTIVQIIRHILFPKAALRQTCATMDELCFWGCAPIAFVTIVAQTALNGSTTSSWSENAQHGFTILAFVLWWIDVAVMLTVAYIAYYLIAKRRMAAQLPIPSFIFLPAVGTTTVGLVGGIIANYSYNASPRLAVPVIMVSYLLEGFGWWLAVLIYPVFLGELWSKGLPPPFKLPTLMMLVGHFIEIHKQRACANLSAGRSCRSNRCSVKHTRLGSNQAFQRLWQRHFPHCRIGNDTSGRKYGLGSTITRLRYFLGHLRHPRACRGGVQEAIEAWYAVVEHDLPTWYNEHNFSYNGPRVG
jgi:hypothetical protein